MNDSDYVTIVVAIVAAIPGILALLGQGRRDKVNAVDKLTDAAMRLVAQHEKEIQQLMTRLDQLERANRRLREGALTLIRQLTAAGMKPEYIPGDEGENRAYQREHA